MKNIEPLAISVKKYTGPNPFKYSQARDYPKLKLVREFVATSKYWSRFNVSNEVLVGTRGSGKTILLRMLTYSSVKILSEGSYKSEFSSLRSKDGIEYFGFYVPLRLRVLREIGLVNDELEERQRFSFLFNCVCAGSILDEIKALVSDLVPDDQERLHVERKLIDKLKEAWGFPAETATVSLVNFQEQIDRLYDKVRRSWIYGEAGGVFQSSLLEPIISVLPLLAEILNLDRDRTIWIACFDEAEYLSENLQKVLNTVMRSESRGLAVKIATLPFHYSEFGTEMEGEFIQPDGDDFRFESIDYQWNENDFLEITNQALRKN